MSNGKAVKLYVIYTTKFLLSLKLSLMRGLRPKSASASPQQCANSAPDFIQIGSLSARL